MTRFEFATANRIIFGNGASQEVPHLANTLGNRALLITDSIERSTKLLDNLKALGIIVFLFEVNKEPDIYCVEMATRILRESGANLIIGFGGGASIDSAKAAAALAANPGNPEDYLEIVGLGRPLVNPSLPMIAIPTTSGTGSEMTRNAVIHAPKAQVKVSLRSPYLLPRLAVIDPQLTYTLSPEITASTGLDALTQCIEPYVCNSPTPLTDVLSKDGILRVARSITSAYQNGKDSVAREDMALASLYGGMCLANARLGAVHGLAAPVGGLLSAPHGGVCARLLPFVMEINIRSLQSQDSDSPFLERYTDVAQILTGNPNATAESGIRYIHALITELKIPPLSTYGINRDQFQILAERAMQSSSMKGNPVALSSEDIINILEKEFSL